IGCGRGKCSVARCRRLHGVQDSSERALPQVGDRIGEVRMIEDVVGVGPQGEGEPFLQAERLFQAGSSPGRKTNCGEWCRKERARSRTAPRPSKAGRQRRRRSSTRRRRSPPSTREEHQSCARAGFALNLPETLFAERKNGKFSETWEIPSINADADRRHFQ